jgi:rhodanese-related sulfurtransferase
LGAAPAVDDASMTTITPAAVAQRLADGATLIDVRTPAEFAAGHASGARNVPLDRLDPQGLPRDVLVICQSGARSRQACERLAAAGLEPVDVAGGTSGWVAAGLPLEGTGAAVFGVERQVRCIIGGGVLVGVVLAMALDPRWALLSGFFGAGLVLAGITNRCPLALLVAAMPWNRMAPAPGEACCVPSR